MGCNYVCIPLAAHILYRTLFQLHAATLRLPTTYWQTTLMQRLNALSAWTSPSRGSESLWLGKLRLLLRQRSWQRWLLQYRVLTASIATCRLPMTSLTLGPTPTAQISVPW